MKKTLALVLAVVTLLCVALTGCTGNGGGTTEMNLNIGPYPDTIDPALNSTVDGGTYIIHAFSGLVGYAQKDDGALELVADCATELPEAVVSEDGKATYTFTLKDGLKWSDGTDLTAEDFVYSWNRAIAPETAADYAYMFDVIDGFAEGKLNITAKDAKTLEVVLTNDVPYFLELCAFPTYLPVKKDVVEGNESWATKVDTYIGNGPYKITVFDQSQIVMEKNEYYHNAEAIKTDKINFFFNADDTSMYANYQNGSYQFIDSVPAAEIKAIEQKYPDEYACPGQLGTYYVCFNVNDKALADFTESERVSIREAISLLIDRQHIVDNISQGGEIPANTFVAMGLTDADGKTEFKDNAGRGNGQGYFDITAETYEKNCEDAVKILANVAQTSGKFTMDGNKVVGFPALTYITNENTNHEAIASYLQGVLALYGIDLKIEVQEWNTFLNTRKDGNYSIARNGWLADYNDPISFLDMWISDSGNNDVQLGKGENKDYKGYSYNGQDNLTWAESYDKLIAEVKATKDTDKRFELMHQAEDLVMSTKALCPIYYYTDPYLCSKDIQGFFASPLGFKYFMYATVA
ncbi:MAG: peptide ABC transporter substrate-binding protein [Eubacteriales bacterium]|nr:peptide ABC transporter substrate-binding protein [Eubacteriales bacterium]